MRKLNGHAVRQVIIPGVFLFGFFTLFYTDQLFQREAFVAVQEYMVFYSKVNGHFMPSKETIFRLIK